MASEEAQRLLMRWAESPDGAGPKSAWPAELRVLASLMLNSSRPTFIAWGTQLRLLYNDAYVAILGERHPQAFGQPLAQVWHDAWPAGEPIVARVMAGVPVDVDDFTVTLQRQGRPTVAHFSFSFSPILDEASGAVLGVLCTCVDSTAAVLARQSEQAEFGDLRRRLALFRKAPGFICVLRGPDYVFEFANDAYEAMMGKRDVIGRTAREVFPEAEEQGLFGLLEQVYRTGERFVARAMPIRIEGGPGQPPREAVFDFVWEPLREADGSVGGIFAMGYDVTPVAAAQQSVHVAERRYGELLETMGEGFIVLDEEFRVVQINAEGLRIDGRARDQLIGRTHWELWPAANGTAVEAAYRHVMRERQPQDLRHRYVGGGLDVWMRIRIYPVSGGVASFYRDITEIVLAEQALQHSNERFRAAIAAIGVLWTNDAEGRMVGEQPGWERLTGQDRAAYEGYGWARAVHPDDAEPTLQAWNRAVESRSTFVFEHRVRRCDGEWRRFSIRAVPVVEDDGRVREWVGVHIDITDAAVAFEALRQADRKKDEFIATLAHELRNPLAPIRTAAHMLSHPELPPDKLQWCSDLIARQVHAMAVLLDDLLDVARITTGRLDLRRARVEVQAAVADALETVRPLVEAKRHRVTVQLDDSLPPLDADPVRVVQILSNLLMNAAKYTDPQGRLGLSARADGDVIVFEVWDNGIGISPEALPTLFEMFSQVSESLDRTEGGLGIGLALTRGLVRLHGGSIEGHSAGLGSGSRFTVTLPAGARTAPAPASAAGTVTADVAAPTYGVLVVDDNVDAAEALAMLLESEGLRVHVAHSGSEALAVAAAQRPQAALLDLGLPGMSGYELAEAIRQADWGRSMVLAVISGWGREDDRRRAAEAGFDHHFTKPVDPGELMAWFREKAMGPASAT